MRNFNTAELRAMTKVLVAIVDEPAETQDLVLRAVRLVDRLPLGAFTALREIGEALHEFPLARRLEMLDHLIDGKALVNPPPAEGQAVM